MKAKREKLTQTNKPLSKVAFSFSHGGNESDREPQLTGWEAEIVGWWEGAERSVWVCVCLVSLFVACTITG